MVSNPQLRNILIIYFINSSIYLINFLLLFCIQNFGINIYLIGFIAVGMIKRLIEETIDYVLIPKSACVINKGLTNNRLIDKQLVIF